MGQELPQTFKEKYESLKGEVHFAQYGSKTLQVEMSSLIPKTEVITVVLLGKSVDRIPSHRLVPKVVDVFYHHENSIRSGMTQRPDDHSGRLTNQTSFDTLYLTLVLTLCNTEVSKLSAKRISEGHPD